MTVSVADLAERVLRRLNVAVVPVAERPALTAIVAPDAIATGALVELTVIAADEPPAPLDQDLALSKVQAVHESMAAQGFIQWPVSAIPRAVSEDYIRLTAMLLASSFGKAAGDPQLYQLIEARVRRMAMVLRAPGVAQRAVMAAHHDQVMRGRARWTTQDIPDALSQAYVYLAAAVCAPEFERPADRLEMELGDRMISRYIALPPSGESVQAQYY